MDAQKNPKISSGRKEKVTQGWEVCSCKTLFKLSCYADALNAAHGITIDIYGITLIKIELGWLNKDEETDDGRLLKSSFWVCGTSS